MKKRHTEEQIIGFLREANPEYAPNSRVGKAKRLPTFGNS